MTPGQMTYHLRRWRGHGLIERIPQTHRYRLTAQGGRTALLCTRVYNRLLRPGLAQVIPNEALEDSRWRRSFDQWEAALGQWMNEQKVPA